MKNVVTSLAVILFAVSACKSGSHKNEVNAASASDTGKAVIVFRNYEHSFGRVEEGEKVSCIFRFLNQGTGDLIIHSAITTCGCTVSKYDRKPIAPGKEGNLEVTFDTSGRNGLQTKTISVKSNASVPSVILKISAEVHSS